MPVNYPQGSDLVFYWVSRGSNLIPLSFYTIRKADHSSIGVICMTLLKTDIQKHTNKSLAIVRTIAEHDFYALK